MELTGRKKGYIEVCLGLVLLVVGYLFYWWSTELIWILIYPPPIEKQVLDVLPYILYATGGVLMIDGIRRILNKN